MHSLSQALYFSLEDVLSTTATIPLVPLLQNKTKTNNKKIITAHDMQINIKTDKGRQATTAVGSIHSPFRNHHSTHPPRVIRHGLVKQTTTDQWSVTRRHLFVFQVPSPHVNTSGTDRRRVNARVSSSPFPLGNESRTTSHSVFVMNRPSWEKWTAREGGMRRWRRRRRGMSNSDTCTPSPHFSHFSLLPLSIILPSTVIFFLSYCFGLVCLFVCVCVCLLQSTEMPTTNVIYPLSPSASKLKKKKILPSSSKCIWVWCACMFFFHPPTGDSNYESSHIPPPCIPSFHSLSHLPVTVPSAGFIFQGQGLSLLNFYFFFYFFPCLRWLWLCSHIINPK